MLHRGFEAWYAFGVTGEEFRLRVIHPAPGSALARARDYGIDLTLLYQNLMLEPDERLAKAGRNLRLVRALNDARERNRR